MGKEYSKNTTLRFFNRIDVKFMLIVGMVTAILLISLFLYIAQNTEESIISEVHGQAEIAHEQVVITRHWNADYGGVYVEKTEGVESNPYLETLGIPPDIVTGDGRIYTLKNPALMTRELSVYAHEGELLEFHITSLDLVNPSNAPDEFEIGGLELFEEGTTQITQIVERNGTILYQYMAPLYITQGCLKCHSDYSVGEVRGGISVFLPMDDANAAIVENRKNLFWTAIAVIGGVEVLLFGLVAMFVGKPMNDLMRGVSHIASGDFSHRIRVRSKDETGILADSFNALASDLQEFIEALTESEERFRKIFANTNDAFCISKEGITEFVNPAFLALSGYSMGEVIGKPLGIILAPKSKKIVTDYILRRSVGEDTTDRLEAVGLTKDGRKLFLDISISTVEFKGEKYTVAVIQDITERKRADEALILEKNKLVNIFESMEDGICIVNQDYDIEYVNSILMKDFGEWEGRKCYSYFHGREEVCPWCNNQDVFSGKTVRWEWKSDKTGKIFDLIDTPLKNLDGSISKLEIFRDITKRRQAEEEISKLNIELEERVAERTTELKDKNAELEEMNRVFVGRELRMAELKKQIAELEKDAEPDKKAGDETT